MKRKLPPLKYIEVFEAAAKYRSFSEAAKVLCLTQGVVNKQIRQLEETLRIDLFEPQDSTVTLTPEGETYLKTVSQALDLLEHGSEKFYDEQKKEILTIDIIPSISVLWMFSRVNQFHNLYPSITMQINSADDDIDWSIKQADIAIRCLRINEADRHDELITKENLKLIASPALLQENPIQSLDDLYQYKLLMMKKRPNLWKGVFNQTDTEVESPQCFSCEHFYMIIQAALADFGIGLAPDFLCEEHIQSGKLVNPLDISLPSGYGYYLMTPAHKRDESKVIKFSEWIKNQL